MKKKLYLVRHGQTLFNQKSMIQGWCDSPLTDLGHRQAKAVRSWLDEHDARPQSFYCSTLGRTEQTIREITDQPYTRKEGLREFHYGTLEGESSKRACPKHVDADTYYQQFGGESHDEVVRRMQSTLEQIMENDPADTILAVSHGSSSFLFAHLVDPEKADRLRKYDNCVIYDFDWEDGQFTLNDIINEHIQGLSPASHPHLSCLPDM